MIQEALAQLKDEEIDRGAVEEFVSPRHAEAFRKVVKEHLDKFPRERQGDLAANIKNRLKTKEITASNIKAEVQRVVNSIDRLERGPAHVIRQLANKSRNVYNRAKSLFDLIGKLETEAEEMGLADQMEDFLKEGRRVRTPLAYMIKVWEEFTAEPVEEKKISVDTDQGRIFRKKDFLGILKILQPALASSEMVEQSTHFLFDHQTIAAYNDQLYIIVKFPTGIQGTVKGNDLLRVIEGIEGEYLCLRVQETDGKSVVEIGDGNHHTYQLDLNAQSLEIAKELAEGIGEEEWQSVPPGLMDALKVVHFSVSDDMTKGPLAGACIVAEGVLSCDNYRLTYVKVPDINNAFQVPRSVIPILTNLEFQFGRYRLDEYCIGQSWMHSQGDNIRFSYRTMGEEYPIVTPLLPQETSGSMIKLPKGLAQDCSKAHRLLKPYYDFDYDIRVKLECTSSEVILSSKEGEKVAFKSRFPIENGPEEGFSVYVRPGFLGDALRVCRDMILIEDERLYFVGDNVEHLLATTDPPKS